MDWKGWQLLQLYKQNKVVYRSYTQERYIMTENQKCFIFMQCYAMLYLIISYQLSAGTDIKLLSVNPNIGGSCMLSWCVDLSYHRPPATIVSKNIQVVVTSIKPTYTRQNNSCNVMDDYVPSR